MGGASVKLLFEKLLLSPLDHWCNLIRASVIDYNTVYRLKESLRIRVEEQYPNVLDVKGGLRQQVREEKAPWE